VPSTPLNADDHFKILPTARISTRSVSAEELDCLTLMIICGTQAGGWRYA
jgi:hypothetical protein